MSSVIGWATENSGVSEDRNLTMRLCMLVVCCVVALVGCSSARICTDGLFTVQTNTRIMHGDGVYLKNMTWAECTALREKLGRMPGE